MPKEYDLFKDNLFFKDNLKIWLKEQKGQFALIHDCKLYGFFSSREDASKAGVKQFELGYFLVKEIIPENKKPKYFSFRVSFA